MKALLTVALGMNVQTGAYGGGNQFGLSLRTYLERQGVKVVHTLDDAAIDAIIVTDTRSWLATCAFDGLGADRYVRIHRNVPIIFRVNECDEKRGDKWKLLNCLIAQEGRLATKVVYISGWLQQLFEKQFPQLRNKGVVIHNGADQGIFNSAGYTPWQPPTPLRLVTHHWSSNAFKGFDVYHTVDKLLATHWRGKVECTYIGNVGTKNPFKCINVVPPKSGAELATAIKQHHVYITASQFEPAGMHHIEGALCGLPLLYRFSGALPEYCGSFGIGFHGADDIQTAVENMFNEYPRLAATMAAYPYTADRMSEQYYKLIRELTSDPVPLVARSTIPLRLARYALFGKETTTALLKRL